MNASDVVSRFTKFNLCYSNLNMHFRRQNNILLYCSWYKLLFVFELYLFLKMQYASPRVCQIFCFIHGIIAQNKLQKHSYSGKLLNKLLIKLTWKGRTSRTDTTSVYNYTARCQNGMKSAVNLDGGELGMGQTALCTINILTIFLIKYSYKTSIRNTFLNYTV